MTLIKSPPEFNRLLPMSNRVTLNDYKTPATAFVNESPVITVFYAYAVDTLHKTSIGESNV